MILSPPFLPDRQAGETDEQFVRRCMTGGDPGSGSYPVSFQMNWHGGVHLTAPNGADNKPLQVRAIADGTVAFVRKPTAKTTNKNHALNYGAGWTDDGCVLIRHETAIGASQSGPTNVVYFSIYMHLSKVEAALKQGDAIYRKAILGSPGEIYGAANSIHFEIICDDTSIRNFTNRTGPYMAVNQDGRTDVLFGSMYFFILVGTDFLAFPPVGTSAVPAVVHNNSEAYPVEMKYEGGDCIMQTYHLDGRPLAQHREPEAEYNLFTMATQTFPGSASAGYELLRFGRVIGPDPLNPPDHGYWREIAFDGGVGWVNLNELNVLKFSDADFPSWGNAWWILVDGSSSADSRCKELRILELLDKNGDLAVTPQEGQAALNDPVMQDQLSHRICKFPTEWDSSTIDKRWAWLQTDPQTKMDAASYARFKAHVTALCFWDKANLGIGNVHWRFHPTQFVIAFRKCGWFSQNELAQMLPRSAGQWNPNAHPPAWQYSNISWVTSNARFAPYLNDLNKTLRKYNLLDAKRQIHFLAQTFIETALWAISSAAVSSADRTMREFGKGHSKIVNGVVTWPAPMMEFYTVFYGRGIMQLTWPANYADYGFYRAFPNVSSGYHYQDNRLTQASTHHWTGSQSPQQLWFSRYDPEDIADSSFNACDSGAFYWVSKNIGSHRININRVADRAFSTDAVGRISVLVNGGGYGYRERQSYAAFLKRYRDDDTALTATSIFQVTHGSQNMSIEVHFDAQRP
jgi:predicted chitinase